MFYLQSNNDYDIIPMEFSSFNCLKLEFVLGAQGEILALLLSSLRLVLVIAIVCRHSMANFST